MKARGVQGSRVSVGGGGGGGGGDGSSGGIAQSNTKSESALRFLVVDDAATARRFVRHMLEKRLGHTVVEATDGANAVKLVAKSMRDMQPYDAIFMDCVMPIMDGMTATTEIKALGFFGQVCSFKIQLHLRTKTSAIPKSNGLDKND